VGASATRRQRQRGRAARPRSDSALRSAVLRTCRRERTLFEWVASAELLAAALFVGRSTREQRSAGWFVALPEGITSRQPHGRYLNPGAFAEALARGPRCRRGLQPDPPEGGSGVSLHPRVAATEVGRVPGPSRQRASYGLLVRAAPEGALRCAPSPPKWCRLPPNLSLPGTNSKLRSATPKGDFSGLDALRMHRWTPKSSDGPQRGSSRKGVVHVKELSEECVPA
jgi:hypothetical protein